MAGAVDDERSARRSVVPERAGRSPWLAAVWTGLGAAVVCALVSIVVVAICWLPVSGDAGATDGRTTSAIKAGLLTFLAGLHGGVTVDGVSTEWVPLGMLLLVALVCWRAGTGLADAAAALGERDQLRLILVGATQTVTFAVGCLIAVPFATLGTSRAPFVGVALGALLVCGASAGTAFVRATALRNALAERISPEARADLQVATRAVVTYLVAGALLLLGSLVMHHGTVSALIGSVGGGWGLVPVLLLSVLAVPNATIAAAAYLAGPGFAVGTGTHASLFGSTHGVVPAFPLLGAMPTSGGLAPVPLTAAILTLVAVGFAAAQIAVRAPTWALRFVRLGGGAVAAGLLMLVLGWQAGGAVGDERLHTVGPSPLVLGGAVAGGVLVSGVVVGGLVLALRALQGWLGAADDDDEFEGFDDLVVPQRHTRLLVPVTDRPADDSADPEDDADESDRAAG